ncbi:solute carrier family 23 protein [Streptomyces noursei]|uniref:solute carrier family 23 protein n=1 Tax=Streptomyces noursei TaxID=1971 RepID=UPI0030F1C9F7
MTERHHRPRAARADGERHPTAGRTVGLGVQHALVMYAGAIAVPLMFGAGAGLDEASVGVLVNADVFVAGVVTLVQSLGVGRLLGARLPVFAESTAQMIAVGEAVERPLTDRALRRGLAADGLSGVLGGAMNSFPDTVFAGNIGLTLMTGVRSRYVTAAGGAAMVLLGTLSKLGELIASLPQPVVDADSGRG